jgi:short-subunit dehydrogenase
MPVAANPRPLAVVTGASKGIGFELAKQLAQHGYDLIINASSNALRQAEADLGALGVQVTSVQSDLTTYPGVEALWSAVEATGRPVEVICINAGIGVYGDFARETSLQHELRLVDLNVTASVHLAKRASQAMVRQQRGKILFTSSIAATMPAPLEAAYGASKAFLLSFSEALANELKDAGITVTALMPGPTETDFFHRAGMDETRVGQKEKDDPGAVAREGFDAMMRGDLKVVAGWKNKLEAAAARLTPDATKAKMHRSLVEPDPDANHSGQ